MITSNIQEEVVTTDINSPQQVTRKTTRQVEPAVKSEAPQKVYDKKRTIFRYNQIIWYVLGFIETLLMFRVILKMLGANQYVGFTSLINALTEPLAAPFSGILGVSSAGASLMEWSTLVAAVVYLCIAWGLIYLLELFFPITPSDVEVE